MHVSLLRGVKVLHPLGLNYGNDIPEPGRGAHSCQKDQTGFYPAEVINISTRGFRRQKSWVG